MPGLTAWLTCPSCAVKEVLGAVASLHLSPFQLILWPCNMVFLNLHGCLWLGQSAGLLHPGLPQQGKCPGQPIPLPLSRLPKP